MTPDTLDRAIDAILAGDLTFGITDETAAASSLTTMVSEIPPSTGRAGVRRAVLTAAAAPRRPLMRRVSILAPVAASLAFSFIAVAARTALPGDSLYQVRRGLQAVRVAVAVGDHSKAVALLDRAERDVQDAERALARSRESDARKALGAFDNDLATARSEIGRLDAATAAPLTERADALEARAAAIRGRATDDDDRSGRDDSGSNSGPGSRDDSDDRSGSGSGDDSSGSGSGRSGSDDSKSGSSGSGSDDSESGSSGSGSDDSKSGSSGSGSDDSKSGSSGSGSDDSKSGSSGSGSDDSTSGSSGSGSGGSDD